MGETVFVLPKLLTLANPDPYSDGGSSPWLAVTVVGWSSLSENSLQLCLYRPTNGVSAGVVVSGSVVAGPSVQVPDFDLSGGLPALYIFSQSIMII